jgi:probable phosphoglycerate mutase
MSDDFPIVYLARHGETEWSLSGRHTGLTDLPLTARGERNARRLGERLQRLALAKVFTSPLQRATKTCEFAGFKSAAEVDRDLVEWNYGDYEGKRSAEILKERPGWQLFRRIACADRRACRSCGPASAVGSGKHADFFQRPFPAGVRGALAGPRADRGPAFLVVHGQRERAELRTRFVGTGGSVLE